MGKGQHDSEEPKLKSTKNHKGMLGKYHSEETKKKISESRTGISAWIKGLKGCFSEEHNRKISEYHKGRLNPNGMKGKHFPNSSLLYYDRKVWKKEVARNDENTCQKCGKTIFKYREKDAHHIIPIKKMPELQLEPENGIVLCRSCHTGFHKKYGDENVGFGQMIKYLGEKDVGSAHNNF